MFQDLDSLQTKIIYGALSGLLAWLIFLTVRSFETPNASDIRLMLETQAPYTRDRDVLAEKLHQLGLQEEKIARDLAGLSKEVIQMRIEVERMLVIKPADVFRKVEAQEKSLARLERLLQSMIESKQAG